MNINNIEANFINITHHSIKSNSNINSYYSSLNEIENSHSYNELEEKYYIEDELIEQKKKILKQDKSSKIISWNEQIIKERGLIKNSQNKNIWY